MNKNLPFTLSFVIGCLAWAAALAWWFTSTPPFEIAERVPGMDGEPIGASSTNINTSNIGEIFEEFSGIPSDIQGSWPRFRGGNIDNISTDNIPLKDFSDGSQPDILWTIDLGEGHAAPAVHNGQMYVLDYDEAGEADLLRCFSLDNGEEIWRRGYKVKVRRNHGMSRTVPAVTDSAVLTVGPMCHAMATHAVTGDLLWGIDMAAQYGAEVPLWYTGQCPLIDDTIAVLAPSGSALLVGVHIMTGKILWETPNRHGWKMSHSSIIPMTFGGRKIYVYCASGGIAGIAADGEDRGTVLFETAEFAQSVVAPSPIAIGNDRIYMTAGYGAGSAVFQVSYEQGDNDGDNGIPNSNVPNRYISNSNSGGGKFSISMIRRYAVRDAIASEQQTPIYHKGHLYGILPKDAGAHRDQFVCVSEDSVSAYKWTSGPDNLYGLGPYLIADNKFYILSDDGVLTVASISTQRFEKRASVKISSGVDAWGPMALAGGRLLLRDSRKMFCVDLRR